MAVRVPQDPAPTTERRLFTVAGTPGARVFPLPRPAPPRPRPIYEPVPVRHPRARGVAVRLGLLGAALIGAGQALPIPSWAWAVGTIVSTGFLFRLFLVRSEKRIGEAKAGYTEAETKALEDRVRRALAEEVEESMQRQRRDVQEARANEAEAIAEVARLVAQHERDRSDWKEERHGHVNRAKDQELQIARLGQELTTARLELSEARAELQAARVEISELRSEVQGLRIDRGFETGRREGDAG